jgi:hypothetical protein
VMTVTTQRLALMLFLQGGFAKGNDIGHGAIDAQR